MPIMSTVKGNLITRAKQGEYAAIAHGCNCFCVMGAGIAPQIALSFPEAQQADDNTVKGSRDKLGTFSVAFNPEHNVWVFNLYTQEGTWGRSQGIPDINYQAVKDSFEKLNKVYGGHIGKIGIPMIGAGLAGGHWQAIEIIINSVTPDLEIELVVYDG